MWTEDKYNDFLNELNNKKDVKYQEFTEHIVNSHVPLMGVRLPVLRDIAKMVSKTNIDEFVKYYQGKTYEEKMIFGLAIAYSNNIMTYDKYLEDYSNEIVDWSLCDSVANSLKLIKKHNDHFYPFVIKMLNSDKEFQIRFGIILMLSHYLNDNYIDRVIDNIVKIKSDKYYVNMAIAWLLCELYIKYPNQIDRYFNSNYFDKFVLNKAISKISDSYRISKEIKEELKKRRIK